MSSVYPDIPFVSPCDRAYTQAISLSGVLSIRLQALSSLNTLSTDTSIGLQGVLRIQRTKWTKNSNFFTMKRIFSSKSLF